MATVISCAMPQPESIVPNIYLGDHENSKIYRSMTEDILCSDPRFDNYICMPSWDFEKVSAEILFCRKTIKNQ